MKYIEKVNEKDYNVIEKEVRRKIKIKIIVMIQFEKGIDNNVLLYRK